MHEKSLTTLEYPKILAKVAGEAAFSASKDLVLALEPTPSIDEARRRLAYTTEASRLIDLHADVGVRGAHDIRPLLVRAARDGVLAPSDLLEVLATVRSSLYVGNLLGRLDAENFPLLHELGSNMPQRPRIAQRIEETISDEGEVLDTASPALRKIRFDLRGANQRLQERLRTLVNEFSHALQDPIITMRNDRYVIPVRTESRSQVRGIVHDQSSSGATVFVEPMVVVELNNRIRELQAEERQEVERILRVLSAEIGKEAEALKWAVELLADFDLHLAKARYGRMTRSNEPRLNEQGHITLHNARHPLLTGRVVPINFHLGRDFYMVVITGPNTGGKSVALKTVGLLTLMAQAGLHVPADYDSELAIFEDVFADIGDEQSVEQSLSTFSSHMTRIIEVLRRVEHEQQEHTPDIRGRLSETLTQKQGDRSRFLVLFDELGAGTDPSEGSALARAILTYLLDRHVTTVATTHYSELKAFAHEQENVTNASVEFDVDTLSPTYKLSIGLPGRSNALAIASRLGLDEHIITRAREFLGSEGVRMESLLEGLQSERKGAEDERFHLSMERAEVAHLRKQLEEERYKLEEQRVRILNEARAQARRELDEVQVALAKVKIDVGKAMTRDRLTQARQLTHNLEAKVTTIPEPAKPRRKVEPEEQRIDGPLQIGDTVRVLSFGQNAELLGLSPDHSEAEVQMGAMRFRVNVDNIERISRRKAAKEDYTVPNVVTPRYEERPEVPLQLDMRGWRVEHAIEEMDAYLNNAALAGMGSVRILHGKGTGALRTAIREQLTHHPLVKSFTPAPANEGGDGVTVVKLSA